MNIHWSIDANGEPKNHSINSNGTAVKKCIEKLSIQMVQMWKPVKTKENNGRLVIKNWQTIDYNGIITNITRIANAVQRHSN